MNDSNLQKKIKNGLIWVFLERIGSKAIQFILQLLLARILVPEDYGLCALLLVFINIATILINSGFPTALIQKADSKSIDYSSVFYFSLTISIIVYILLFVYAPFIASLFGDSRISFLLRILSISLITGSYNSVQIAFLSKQLLFKKQFKANLIGIIISAILSIILAYIGLGIWSLIIQYLSYQIASTIILCFLTKWHPTFEFSFTSLINLFNFGWKCMARSSLATIITSIYTATIGKFFTKYQLGIYDTGNKIPSTISDTVNSALNTVLFSAFSSIQNDKNRLKLYVKKANQLSCFLIFPLMLGIASMANSIVYLILTDKWAEAIPYLQMACIMYAFYPLHIANISAISAQGYSNITLRNELYKKGIEIVALLVCIKFDLFWIAMGRVIASLIAIPINMYPNKQYLNYSIKEQLMDIKPTFFISTITSISTYVLYLIIDIDHIPILVIQIVFFLMVYTFLTYLFNRKLLVNLISILKQKNTNYYV